MEGVVIAQTPSIAASARRYKYDARRFVKEARREPVTMPIHNHHRRVLITERSAMAAVRERSRVSRRQQATAENVLAAQARGKACQQREPPHGGVAMSHGGAFSGKVAAEDGR